MTIRSDTLIIVPAFNEADIISQVLAELEIRAPHLDVVVIDDGSTDETGRLARASGVPVISLAFNLGVGGALRTGFKYAVEKGYKHAIQIDADGQHEIDEITKLLDALDEGADMVIGSRFATERTQYEVGRIRNGAMRLLTLLVRLLTGHQFTDTTAGFRAFSGPLIQFFADSYPSEYLSDTVEALLVSLYSGYTVVEVATTMSTRRGGKPSHRNLKLIYHYLRVLLVVLATASLKARKERKKVI